MIGSVAFVRRVRDVALEGVRAGGRTMVELAKLVFPLTVLVSLLREAPFLPRLAEWLAPAMHPLGLSGEAALVLVLGNVLNLYAAIGAMLGLPLSAKEAFILAVMLGFSHNLLVETAVVVRLGMRAIWAIGLRIGLAILSALVLAHLWPDEMGRAAGKGATGEGLTEAAAVRAAAGTVEEASLAAAETAASPSSADVRSASAVGPGGAAARLGAALQTGVHGLVQMALIVFPLMVGVETLKAVGAIDRLSRGMGPFLRWIGLSERAAVTFLAGLLFGLQYGAGLMLESARKARFSRQEVMILVTFLSASHAVVEDTLLFVPVGVSPWALFAFRTAVAIALAAALARIWIRPRRAEAADGRPTGPG
ncbi:nucleoside recognition domain-containing protein [Hydrogenibacillus schlegelii]|uniref:Nucleoside transporter/FeoB GTPase Gate domain-containing protein n=1 Tax=Hydrogenibacillus schlegelii TaxID=1484 RepID=A0A179IQ61_HYDSH|nr:nucleoside recognition domain-containing protein [Hydrogenibacillus schlegelii]OAR03992.1 hypothetical protein SA87_02945 [Hydrogenibacillus schlegelii]